VIFHRNGLRRDAAPARVEAPARAFHERLPGYAVTPLRSAPELARELGVAQVLLKDETERLGLPAFKVLGAAWAAHRALEQSAGDSTLVTASAGNHGRAVARVARLLGTGAHVLVPAGTARSRIAAIRTEGATVEVVEGSYDDAVARAAALADSAHVLVQDTAWPGYERIPAWIVDGYRTIFAELAEQLEAARTRADLVLLPVGVGSFAAAGVLSLRGGPTLVSVEPDSAACLLASLRAGEPATAVGPHASIMAGLNCGSVSSAAWPVLRDGIDAAIAIPDAVAVDGMRALARLGIAAGECAGGVVGAARALLAGPHRADLGVKPDAVVVLPLTEGVTDPAAYEPLVGVKPARRRSGT
jgi:diaminopropionate ammonia-lyase